MTFAPLFFRPDVHQALWGTEAWLVSAHPTAPSVVAEGPFAGRTLDALAATYGRAFMGTRAPSADTFPLLFKIIDARDVLSVQVHPNARTAKGTSGDPKTEMWYVLDRPAPIYAGLVPGTAPEDVTRTLAEGTFADRLVKHEAAAGDVLFIPGGLVHAIGAGARVFEVQQSSNTTYRLYDWDRLDAAGRPRRLHVAESLRTIDFSLPPPARVREVACPFFRFATWSLDAPRTVPADPETFRVFHVAQGSACLSWQDGERTLLTGDTVLVPSSVPVAWTPRERPALLLVSELG